MHKEKQQRENQQGQEIKLVDNIAGAEYSNVMQVFHNKEEFRLMFAHVFEPSGKVVSKITMTPAHFKRMVKVLQENLARYEKDLGNIDDEDTSQHKIGFHDHQ